MQIPSDRKKASGNLTSLLDPCFVYQKKVVLQKIVQKIIFSDKIIHYSMEYQFNKKIFKTKKISNKVIFLKRNTCS